MKKYINLILMLILLTSFATALEWVEDSTFESSVIDGIQINYNQDRQEIFDSDLSFINYETATGGAVDSLRWDGLNWVAHNPLFTISDEYKVIEMVSFELEGREVLLIGYYQNTPQDVIGYQRVGDTLVINNTLGVGVSMAGSRQGLVNVNLGGTLGLINLYTFHAGYSWNGAGWTADNSIVSGLDTALGSPSFSNGVYNMGNSFDINGTTYLIASGTELLKGARWTGSNWVSDSSIVAGLESIFSSFGQYGQTTFETFIYNGDNYLMVNFADNEEYQFYKWGEGVPVYENVTLKLNDDGTPINEFSVDINSQSFSTTNGTIVTPFSLETNLNYNVFYYDIVNPLTYGVYLNKTDSSILFTNVDYIHNSSINLTYDYIKLYSYDLDTNKDLTNFTININSQNYTAINKEVLTDILLDNSKTFNVTFYNYNDDFKIYDSIVIEKTFDISNKILNQSRNGYYNNLTFYAYDYNNSLYIQNFTLTVNLTKEYSTLNGIVVTDILLNKDYDLPIYYEDLEHNDFLKYYDSLYVSNALFNVSSNEYTANIESHNKELTTIITDGTINWLDEINFNTGIFNDIIWNNHLELNNTLSGSFCSAIENTNFTTPTYVNMTFNKTLNNFVVDGAYGDFDLIALYHLDDDSTNILNEVDGINASYSGLLNNQEGVLNDSIGFDGSESITTNIDLQGKNKITLSAWFYKDLTTQRVDLSQSNNANNLRFKLLTNSNGKIYGVIDGGVIDFDHSETGWFHLTMVYDGTKTITNERAIIYLNGVEQTGAYTGTIPSVLSDMDNPFKIGYDDGSNFFSSGNIDEVLIINDALTSEEVFSIYNATEFNNNLELNVINSLNFTLRTCNDSLCDIETYEDIGDDSTVNLLNVDKLQYVEWCADFQTNNIEYSPTLDDVKISFMYESTIPAIINISPVSCNFRADVFLVYDDYPFIEVNTPTLLSWRINENGNEENIVTNLTTAKLKIDGVDYNLTFNPSTLNYEVVLIFDEIVDINADFPYRLMFKEDLSSQCDLNWFNGEFKVREFADLTINTFLDENLTTLYGAENTYLMVELIDPQLSERDLFKSLIEPINIANYWFDKAILKTTGLKLDLGSEQESYIKRDTKYYHSTLNGGNVTFSLPLDENLKISIVQFKTNQDLLFNNDKYSYVWENSVNKNYDSVLTNYNFAESSTLKIIVGDKEINSDYYFLKLFLIFMGLFLLIAIPYGVFYLTQDSSSAIKVFIILLIAVPSLVTSILFIGGFF